MLLPNLHILGIQGSGKGTQVTQLVQHFQLTPIATGELFRARAQVPDEYGAYVAKHLEAGELLTAEDLRLILETKLKTLEPGKGILGDGVLRTVEQWEMLKDLWPQYGLGEPMLIFLNLPDQIARERIKRRHGIEDRSDDLPHAIERRIELFHQKTMAVVELFTTHGRCATIDAQGEVGEITSRITKAVHTFFPEFTKS
ncbi:adenylate kinase [soil metagenome]